MDHFLYLIGLGQSMYPQGPVPLNGEYVILEGNDYIAARNLANRTNAAIHKANPALNGLKIHEIKPVKFNGSPTDPANKMYLTPEEHQRFTRFWNELLRNIKTIKNP